MILQEVLGHESGQEVAGDKVAPIIDGKKAVSVTIESETDVGVFRQHPLFQFSPILWLQRVQAVVGQAAIRVEVHTHQFHREALVDALQNRPYHPVAGVGNDLHRSQR